MARIKRNEFPDFSGHADALQRTFRAMPAAVGTMAVNFYKDRFRRQGWQDERFEAWKPRKGRPDRRRRALLVQSGRLRRSIRVIRSSFDSVTVGTDVPYARTHNEGARIAGVQSVRAHARRAHRRRGRTVRAHEVAAHTRNVSFTIPQRQFMGPSKVLTKRIVMNLNKALERILD